MKKVMNAADLTANSQVEAISILNKMKTVVEYQWSNDGLVTVEYNTSSNDEIEKDFLRACASLDS